MTSNMIYIVALGVGFKCPSKIHLSIQCPPPLQPSYSCASFTRGPGHLSRSNHQGSLKKTQCAELVFTSGFIVEIKALLE